MADFLFIESRDPVADRRVDPQLRLLLGLAERKHRVELYLVQQAVLLGSKHFENAELAELLRAGVAVHADDFSLQQRAISVDDVKAGCQVSPVSRIVEALEGEWRVVWN